MSPEAPGRRPIYFAFQGLFTAVLLLLFLFQPGSPPLAARAVLAFFLGGSLVALRLASDATLAQWWFQAGIFVGDAVAATGVLRLVSRRSDLFLLYLLVVFGSALTRRARERLLVAGVAIALYLVSGWNPVSGWPAHSDFWLRAMFLAVSTALMAVLARDANQAQAEQKRRYEERLVSVGRLATLGRVAGEVAHRIKGPLTTIAVDAEVLAHRHAGDAKTIAELSEIRDEVERCKSILKDLLDLGRIEEMDARPFDLREPLRSAFKSTATQARRAGIAVSSSGLDAPLRVRGDASLLREAFAALLQNAVEACAKGGSIRVEASSAGGERRVAVSDDGAGIAADDLERVFEPFFTTKKGEGSGLGLSAALRIAAKHGGTIEADSAGPGKGARFTLTIPAA